MLSRAQACVREATLGPIREDEFLMWEAAHRHAKGQSDPQAISESRSSIKDVDCVEDTKRPN